MDNVDQAKSAEETKATGAASAAAEPPTNKFAIARLANKQRKKRAHRRSLRRSNTKG